MIFGYWNWPKLLFLKLGLPFGCLKGVSKSVQLLFNGTESVMALTFDDYEILWTFL